MKVQVNTRVSFSCERFECCIRKSYFFSVNYPALHRLFLITDYRTGSVKDSAR